MKVNSIENNGKYVGYIWKSNEKTPKVFNGDIFDESLDNNDNPFIIEGQLYDEERAVSYSIKFVDGEYLINKFEVNSNELGEFVMKTFYANRIKGHKKLCFRQYWRSEKDEFCENMEVLQPKELVFVGFKEEEKEK